MICIFDGNLVLYKSDTRFLSWLHARDTYSKEKIKHLQRKELTRINGSAWLSGFIDAEGCFNSTKIKDERYTLKFRVRLRFILDQKGEKKIFYNVQDFLQSGVISNRAQVDCMYRFTSTSIYSHKILIKYLQSYSLRTTKRYKCLRFCDLLGCIESIKESPWEGQVLLRVESLLRDSSLRS